MITSLRKYSKVNERSKQCHLNKELVELKCFALLAFLVNTSGSVQPWNISCPSSEHRARDFDVFTVCLYLQTVPFVSNQHRLVREIKNHQELLRRRLQSWRTDRSTATHYNERPPNENSHIFAGCGRIIAITSLPGFARFFLLRYVPAPPSTRILSCWSPLSIIPGRVIFSIRRDQKWFLF